MITDLYQFMITELYQFMLTELYQFMITELYQFMLYLRKSKYQSFNLNDIYIINELF